MFHTGLFSSSTTWHITQDDDGKASNPLPNSIPYPLACRISHIHQALHFPTYTEAPGIHFGTSECMLAIWSWNIAEQPFNMNIQNVG